MKKTLLILAGLSISFLISAQDVQKQKEVGVVFSNFDNFGLTFKTGNKNSMWRFSSLFCGGQKSIKDPSNLNRNEISTDLKIGKEFRKSINDNFEFRYGLDLAFGYGNMKSYTNDKQIRYSPSINLVLGVNYITKNNIILGAELLPYVGYSIQNITETNNNIPT